MTTRTVRHIVSRCLVVVSAIAFAAVVGLPHYHNDASHVPAAHHCRVCKLQEGFSAAPPAPVVSLVSPVGAVADRCPPVQPVRVVLVVRSSAPRAPPVSS